MDTRTALDATRIRETGHDIVVGARQSPPGRFRVLYPFSLALRGRAAAGNRLLNWNSKKIELIWRYIDFKILLFTFYYNKVTLFFFV